MNAPALTRARGLSWYLLGAVLVLLAAGLWGRVIAHVVDYWDGASTELREDFVAFYTAGSLLRAGVADAIYQPEAVAEAERAILGRPAGRHDGLAFMNPPFVAGLFEPLTALSYGKAQAVWFGLSALSVVGSLVVLWPEIGRLPRRWALLFALAALSSFPVAWSLLYGQLSPLLLLSWVLSYRLFARGGHACSGLALAASLIKPQLALVPALYLLTTGRWRALAGFGAGAALLLGVSLLLVGPHVVFVDYPVFLHHSLAWREQFGMNRAHMFGWYAFLSLLLPETDFVLMLLLTGAVSVATLVVAIYVWRRHRHLENAAGPMLALATATILVSPHLHTHDLQILVLPAALLVASRRDALAIAVPALLLFLVPTAIMGVNLATPALAATLLVLLAGAIGVRPNVPVLQARLAGAVRRVVGIRRASARVATTTLM